jgi:polyisoprenoid-binding protein YceI
MKRASFFSIVISIPLLLLSSVSFSQNVYSTYNGKASFFSHAPVSDITAQSKEVIASYDATTGKVNAEISITTFEFPRSLMQQHFNDRYLESQKYPKAKFEGIMSRVRTDSVATYRLTAHGTLLIHGVTQERTLPLTLIVNNNGIISAETNFPVKLKDHNIEIPTLLFKEITDTIDVSLALTLSPSKI